MGSKTGSIKFRLSLLNFLEFAIWGSYLTSLGNFLARAGFQTEIGWFYAVQGIVSLIMPSLIGIIADRWVQAQRMLSLCHLIGGLFMALAGIYCMHAGADIEFGPLFTLYAISVAFFMPTIGLNNSVAFNALTKAGMDTIKDFPPIRIWGTIGFICAMLFVNFAGPADAKFQTTYMQLFVSAGFSLLMVFYALTMPKCPTSKAGNSSLVEMMGLKAFTLFKQKKMAIFFIFSMLLGVSLQITNGYANTYITFFKEIPAYMNAWAAQNANAIIAISQCSETLCILLIPFCLKRFGIKGVVLMSMLAWVLRFGFFGLGNPSGGLWLLVLSCIVYGIAFDFFNVSGGLYVDKETTSDIRSSAQGLFMIMTNGFGATVGTLCAMAVVNHFVIPTDPVEVQLHGWRTCWYIFAAYALVVGVLFFIFFKDSRHPAVSETAAEDLSNGGDGFVDSPKNID